MRDGRTFTLATCHRRRSAYNILGVHGNVDARRAERGEVLEEGMFTSPPVRESGRHCSPSAVPG